MSRAPSPLDGPTIPQRQLAPPHGDRAWIDRVIGGKYAVEGVIGRGGMGVVLKARHMRLEELVAIKVLHASLADDQGMAERMLREARAALRLSSEHIVRVMDVDMLEEGVPYLVLEYLEGIDVSTLMKQRGRLPTEEVVAIVEQACRALIEAHALGIIHRDLKPANLFIANRPDGRRVLKLLDFGISKISAPREKMITRKGDILGSPRYMSPEQVRGEALDGRADIWSLGVVLYEMLGGESPFLGANFAQTCNRVLNEPHRPLGEVRPDLPQGLTGAVDRCLHKDRELRFADASALHDALAPFGPMLAGPASQVSLPGPMPSAPPVSGPRSLPAGGAPGAQPGEQHVAPPSATQVSGGAPEVLEITDTDAAPTNAVSGKRRRSRAFLWIALGGLALGLAAGVAVLVRGRAGTAGPLTVATSTGAAAASEGPGATAARATVPPDGAPAPAPNPKNTQSAQNATGPGASEPSLAGSSSAGAGAGEPAAPGASAKVARPAASAKPAASGTDPFGERRQ